MDNTKRQLKLLRNEDFIWFVYYFIVTFALISNHLERKNLLNKQDKQSENISRNINTTILIVALLIYFYFTNVAIQEVGMLNSQSSSKLVRVTYERLFTNIVILISGVMALITDLDNTYSTEVDLAIF